MHHERRRLLGATALGLASLLAAACAGLMGPPHVRYSEAELNQDGATLHRLKPEQVERLAQAGFELGEVEVDAAGVAITAVARR